MRTTRTLLLVIFLSNLLANFLLAAPPDEDDEEFRPGLVAEYRAGERAVTRIDPDVAFAWDEAAPDARLSAERFEATWRGLVLIRLEAKHRLHAFVQGEVTVELDGRRVLHGSAKQPQWISGDEFVPGFAERPLVVTFRKTEPAAQLKLFWSSDAFGLEPLPPELLFHDDSRLGLRPDPAAERKNADQAQGRDGVPTYALIEKGRQQFAAFRCGRCHVREGDARSPAAPSLHHVAAGMTVEQIATRLSGSDIKTNQASGAASAPRSRDDTPRSKDGATGGLTPPRSPRTSEWADRRMPHFRLTDEQARHLAAFLVQQSEPVKLDEPKPLKSKPPKQGELIVAPQRSGEVLLRSVGCLACHRVGELGNANDLPFAGPDLTNIGKRRTQPWLLTWLSDPQRLNADHRMPVFTLADEERQAIVAALVNDNSKGERGGVSPPGENSKDRGADAAPLADSTQGRRLFEQLRCAACHRVKDSKLAEFARAKSDLSQPITDWSKACWDNGQQPTAIGHQPDYHGLDQEAIKAFLTSRWDHKLSPDSQFVRGQRMLEEKNCFACHPRHGGLGLGHTAKQVASMDKDLNGQAPALVAPSLNAVGDKLLDEALSIAVRGERQPIRMPWLKVRMPKFKHSPDELATLTRYLVEHDRIPAATPASGGRQPPGVLESGRVPTGGLTPPARQDKVVDAHTHLAGQALTGVRGWSCIACHKIGDYEPKQVALGARGSDLKMLGKHIRPEFFFRWIASPLRVIPGVEMPQYNRPVAGVLDGDLAKQHAALWQALNDPNFQPPTSPANVEQLWVVNPGERPRIIRDVFQLPKELGGGNVARAFAVGFGNGHSLLFDAERASVRQWTFGDFARQQVVGKRWFWQMAGVDVVSSWPVPQFALRRKSAPESHVVLASAVTSNPMGSFRVDTGGLHLSYSLSFNVGGTGRDGSLRLIHVDEKLSPVPTDGQSNRAGIERHLSLRWESRADTTDLELWFARPAKLSGVGRPRIERDGTAAWQRLPVRDLPDDAWEWTALAVAPFSVKPIEGSSVSLRYSAELPRSPLTNVARPIVLAERRSIASVPGFNGVQLPLDASIMPTGFDWHQNGQLVLSSLKGHIFAANDADGDQVEDRLHLLHEGLCGPYGVLFPERFRYVQGPTIQSLLVATKSDLVMLTDIDGDGYLEQQQLDRSHWGYTDDYHEWASGPFRDAKDNLYVGLASDYTDKNRPKDRSLWRGKVLKREPQQAQGRLSVLHPVGHAFRYPTGIAINDRDEVFVSDQQGVQNCFNEINYLVEGAHYGVPSTHEEDKDAPEAKAAIQIPHPWTRSVNGLVFLTGKEGYPDLKGHGIGCEYNGRFLIRFSTQRVGDVMQGAVYPFSLTDDELVRGLNSTATPLGATNAIEVSGGKPAAPRQQTVPNFEGPLCCGVSPKGEIYIGSIADSGWAGGQNTGSIVKLKGNGQRPNGIREIRATHDGFDIDFFAPVDRARATNPEHYSISGYTRVWGGAYATPDSDRHRCRVLSIELSDDAKTAKLKVDSRKAPNYVYDISCREVADPDKPLFPAYGFFTLHKIPTE